MSFANDMGVWRCEVCGCKLYSSTAVFVNGKMLCKECADVQDKNKDA